jgi:hypothetical protein
MAETIPITPEQAQAALLSEKIPASKIWQCISKAERSANDLLAAIDESMDTISGVKPTWTLYLLGQHATAGLVAAELRLVARQQAVEENSRIIEDCYKYLNPE